MQNTTDVDGELQNFEDNLRYKIYHHLKYDINHGYWEELDELDNESNAIIIDDLKTAFPIATAANEEGVANFIAERIDVHQKWQWKIKASLGTTFNI